MTFPIEMLIFLAISAVCCSIGFYRFVWFLSVGYGLAAAGLGVGMLVYSIVSGSTSVGVIILCALYIIYGVRLGGFLLFRELKNIQYRAKLKEVGGETKVPVFVSFFMWILLAALYVAQSASPLYRILNGAENASPAALYAGIAVSAIGILLESFSDRQKSAEKKTNPDMPAMHGLFKLCRCPNYFGEILFWTGSVISGIGAVRGAQWAVVAFGYICIVGIMVSGAKRVETRHIRHYGGKPEYEAYADHTPLLVPFLPIYHMTSPEKIAKEDAAKAAKKAKKAEKK